MDAFSQYGITSELLEEAFPYFVACDHEFRITMLGRSIKETSRTVAIGAPLVEHATVYYEATNEVIPTVAPVEPIDQNVTLEWIHGSCRLSGHLSCRDNGYLFLVCPANEYAESTDQKRSDIETLVLRLEHAASEKERRNITEKDLVNELKAAGDLCVHFDAQKTIIDVKVACQAYLEMHPTRLISLKLPDALPQIDESIESAIAALQGCKQPQTLTFQLGDLSSGYQFDARLGLSDTGDYVLLARDVTERCQLEERLAHRTLHDPLTGLANRKQFQFNAVHALQKGRNIAVLLADVDDFKSINDSLGEEFGDSVLRILAERVRCYIRDGDTAFRTGSDEFGILLSSDCPLEFAESVAQRLTIDLCRTIQIGDLEIEPQVSIGLALGAPGQSFEETMRDAGFAMERAKGQKKSSVVVCDDAVRNQLQERNTMKREISRAVRQGEFVPFYQPIVNLETKRIVGFEALVRWDHPTRGMLSPFFFLDIAEETGAIVEIGELVLDRACHDLKKLTELYPDIPLKVNVNLASQQVQDLRLITVIKDVLRRSRLDPRLLTLEITETALIEDFEKAKRVICNVREQGIKVALDDFGAGHSSLTYLQQLSIDYLKLDRALISSVCDSESQHAITDCVIRLGKALKLQVVAEGIENEEQHRAVTDLGCDLAQGFLFAKPGPIEQAIELLAGENKLCVTPRIDTTLVPSVLPCHTTI